MLKKSFQKKDVTRIRNLVKGKSGEKISSQVGYKKSDDHHTEGDIWESNGRTWTIKDGIKQNITKLDAAKQAHLMPLLCPKCGKVMRNRNDKPFYKIHKKCFNCVIDFEAELKRTGKWEEYENKIHNDEIDNKIKDFKEWIYNKANEKSTYVSEAGDVERWVGAKIDLDRVDEYVKESVEYLEALKR